GVCQLGGDPIDFRPLVTFRRSSRQSLKPSSPPRRLRAGFGYRRQDHESWPSRFRRSHYTRRIGYKLRRILAVWNRNTDCAVRSYTLVIFGQPLPEPVGLHSNDGIPLLVKVGRTPECL